MKPGTRLAMAVVEPLRRADPPDGQPDRENVVRIVDFLGPISPELVLVDPDLARRARALLPEVPSGRLVRSFQAGAVPGITASSGGSLSAPRRRPLALGVCAALLALVLGFVGWRAGLVGGERPEASSTAVTAPGDSTAHKPLAVAGTPAPRPPSQPRTNVVTAPRFVWPSHPGATGYRLALFRDGRKIFEHDVEGTAFALPTAWSYGGRLEGLTPGTYRWVVWPLLGDGTARRVGAAIVSARYAV